MTTIPTRIPIPSHEAYLREIVHLPDGWWVARLSVSPEDVPKGFVRIEGAVMPLNKSGFPIWSERDKATAAVHFVNISDFEKWLQAKADALGVCVRCWGNGTIWSGWSKVAGVKYRPCPACSGKVTA